MLMKKIRAALSLVEARTLSIYEEEKLFEKKKAGILLHTEMIVFLVFLLFVLPTHWTFLYSKPFLVIGDAAVLLGAVLSSLFVWRGRMNLGVIIAIFTLFLGPFFHNVIGDYLLPVNVGVSRYFESVIVVCFFFPLTISFSIRRTQVFFAMVLAILQVCGHFIVLRAVGVEIETTYLIYVIVIVIPGIVSMMSLNIVNEAILNLARGKEQLARWNRELEETVESRTEELLVMNRRLEAMSNTDGLTGIANRRRYDEVFQQEWNRAKRCAGEMAVFMVDLDQFKLYNDFFGHLQGDRCLKEVAAKLDELTQRSGEVAARYGGEEFVILIPNCSIEEARAYGERIRREVEQLGIRQGAGADYPVLTISVGVAAGELSNYDEKEAFLRHADELLYAAKRNGRNRVES